MDGFESSIDDSKMEDEPANYLTFGQFQGGVRKEALARKGIASTSESHKKGHLELITAGSN